ncbi:MAG TPA: M48 family metallopeptidase [Polyangiaceae bacterium]|nr:M48 family metallopeptidase [Polyangiaceae bacterium]
MNVPITVLYLATIAGKLALSALNVRHRRTHGHLVPSEFEGRIDPTRLAAISAYHADRERLGLVQTLFWAVVVFAFMFGGGLTAYDQWVAALIEPGVLRGVVFFVGLQLGTSLLELPFEIYSTFSIEQKHGFNRMTVGLFVTDTIKSLLLGTAFLALIGAAGLAIIDAAPQLYWLWFWVLVVAVAVLLMLIAPYVIEPLFIKTSPLKDEALAQSVRALADRVGVEVKQVLEMDASRRTAHSNAYFTGIGRVKRVVLFDTLLQRLTHDEILAVLGHELGHWRLRHVSQRLITTAAMALLLFYLGAQLLAWQDFSTWLGLGPSSLYAKLVMLAFIAGILGFAITPLSAYWSRRHEWQADEFASKITGQPQQLASALVKLAEDNLTNLHPHPFYATFYYSHPPTAIRVRKLRERAAVLPQSA